MGTNNPTVPTASVSGIRNRVLHDAIGTTDSTKLTSAQQTYVTDLMTERFAFIFQVAKRFASDTVDADSDDLPAGFQTLYYHECVYHVVKMFRGPDAAEKHRPNLDREWDMVLGTYAPDVFGATSQASATSFFAIDKWITSITLRRKDRRIIPSHSIDQAVKHEFSMIWNAKKWPFRRREVTLSIDTSSNVSGTIGAPLDFIATRRMYYTDNGGEILWLEPDTFSQQRAVYASTTGRPMFFRMQDEGTNKKFSFLPAPDQTYSVACSVWLDEPTLPTSRTDSTTGFSLLPRPFHPLLWFAVAGELLSEFDDSEIRTGYGYKKRADSLLDQLGESFAEIGPNSADLYTTDVYGDLGLLMDDQSVWG